MRSETQPYSTVIAIRLCPYQRPGCVALRMRFFSQNFGTIKRILPGSSSPSHREGPGTEVETPLDARAFGAQWRLRFQLLLRIPVDASVRKSARSAPGNAFTEF